MSSSGQRDTVTITSIDESELLVSNGESSSAVPIMELEPSSNALKMDNAPISLAQSSSSSSPSLSSPSSSFSSTTTTAADANTPSTSTAPPQDDPTVVPGSSKDGTSEKTEEGEQKDDEKKDESMFECNICLDTAKDAVVSMCGHLFCWPCLHQWLETRPRKQLCPVCKAAVSKDKVIPLYGRGSTNQQDPRTKVPPRPAGQRTEPEPGGFQGFGMMDGGFHMSFGIGAFPLGYLSSSFNFDGRRGNRAERGTAHFEEEQFLSKVFIWVATIFLAWLVFVY